MMLVCIKTSIKASRAEDKAASEYEAANCCGLSGRKNNRYVRCSNGDYPRQNGLAVALRELGRIERTLFILDWLQGVELRRRVHAGLNKGAARNALARAVFFNRLGEIRDRRFEQQRDRASGLNLVTAAIVLWNPVYLERAAHGLRGNGHVVDDALLQYLSPLGWEHINLPGDYLWRSRAKVGGGKFRPLRPLPPAWRALIFRFLRRPQHDLLTSQTCRHPLAGHGRAAGQRLRISGRQQ